MRMLLLPLQLGGLPSWPQGTAVDCTVGVGATSYHAEAIIVRQDRQRVWVRVPAEWLDGDRRSTPRRPGGFAVRVDVRDGTWDGVCLNISEGGMCIEVADPAGLRQSVTVRFRLPGDAEETAARGTVMWIGPAQDPTRMRIGIAFEPLVAATGRRIAEFCRDATDAPET